MWEQSWVMMKARSHFKSCRPHLNQTPMGDASENMWSAHPIWSKLAGVMHRRMWEWTATITLSRTHSGRCGSFYWTLFFCLDYGYIEFIIDNVNPLWILESSVKLQFGMRNRFIWYSIIPRRMNMFWSRFT